MVVKDEEKFCLHSVDIVLMVLIKVGKILSVSSEITSHDSFVNYQSSFDFTVSNDKTKKYIQFLLNWELDIMFPVFIFDSFCLSEFSHF